MHVERLTPHVGTKDQVVVVLMDWRVGQQVAARVGVAQDVIADVEDALAVVHADPEAVADVENELGVGEQHAGGYVVAEEEGGGATDRTRADGCAGGLPPRVLAAAPLSTSIAIGRASSTIVG